MRALLSRLILSLRYRVEVSGLEEIAGRGTRGVLFLPNHPALIDPVILMAVLYRRFRPRALADRDQIDRFFVRSVARHLQVIEMPDLLRRGAAVRGEVADAIDACADALRSGDNLVLYPSGRLQTSRLESLGGASAVGTLLSEIPDCRIVLVRISGLWGSSFGWARGREPTVAPVLLRGLCAALASGVAFMPKRLVGVESVEPSNFPRQGTRDIQNRYLESFYNQDPKPAFAVPMTPWRGGSPRLLPDLRLEPNTDRGTAVPNAVRWAVYDHLQGLAGVDLVADDDRLAEDLTLDSLQRAELAIWLQDEFGAPRGDLDTLISVSDVLHLAGGNLAVASSAGDLKPVPAAWFKAPTDRYPPAFFDAADLVSAFLSAAKSAPNLPILADQTAGVRTYRQLLTGIAAMQSTLLGIPSTRVGLMLPATVGADVIFLALLFAGKTPVMVNWTVGTRHLVHGLNEVGCETVLTARALVDRLADQGVDLEPLRDRFLYLEDIVSGIGFIGKLRALVSARMTPHGLAKARREDIAVILFTSGSESLPKAVPLSDSNILSNLRDIFSKVPFVAGDRLLSVLPPFHSFGLTAGVLMPILGRIPTAHYPVPTDGAMLAAMVEAYDANLMGGTPTFLGGMIRAAGPGQLRGLRLAVTGGERFPDQLRQTVVKACPEAVVLEGYGITECSPIISINAPGEARDGTVGRPLPSLRHLLVKPGSVEPVRPGEAGELLVSGPSVFDGYLVATGTTPFVDIDGTEWYRTGDLVCEDPDGFLVFKGRLKRFIKLGGEMISLPAIEEILAEAYPSDDDGPLFAIEASSDDLNPEVVLFTTSKMTRREVNAAIRAAGLSPLHAVRRIVHLEALPVLGTGKVDYRSLRELASTEDGADQLGAPC